MSRKTVAFRRKLAQTVRAGKDMSVLFPSKIAIGKGSRGGWKPTGSGYRHVIGTNPGTVCSLPMSPEKRARLTGAPRVR